MILLKAFPLLIFICSYLTFTKSYSVSRDLQINDFKDMFEKPVGVGLFLSENRRISNIMNRDIYKYNPNVFFNRKTNQF